MKFPFVYYLNRDIDVARNNSMLKMLTKNNISEYTRFPAIKEEDFKKYIDLTKDVRLSTAEISCTLSHLSIINNGLESDLEYFLVFEDDVDINTIQYFNFSFLDFINSLPNHWEIIQLASHGEYFKKNKIPKLIQWEPMHFGTAAYLIRSSYAKKIISYYKDNGLYNIYRFFEQEELLNIIKNEDMRNPAADRLLYSLGNAYTINLFSFFNFKSTIGNNLEKEKREKIVSKNINSFWKQNSPRLSDLFI